MPKLEFEEDVKKLLLGWRDSSDGPQKDAAAFMTQKLHLMQTTSILRQSPLPKWIAHLNKADPELKGVYKIKQVNGRGRLYAIKHPREDVLIVFYGFWKTSDSGIPKNHLNNIKRIRKRILKEANSRKGGRR